MSVEQFNDASGNLERILLKGPNNCSAEIYLFGATVTSWKSAGGKERLFLSNLAKLDGTKAIRGGIPLVFPQFGPGDLPQHGFARNRRWEFEGAQTHGQGVVANFALRDNEETRGSKWPYKFYLHYTVDLTATTLSTIIKYENMDTREFEFTSLMHTYLRVPDIKDVKVRGLKDVKYADKIAKTTGVVEDREQITVAANEDRVYQDIPLDDIVDVEYDRDKVSVRRFNFKDIVLWNPWSEKAREMSDFADNEYQNMICVEAGTVASSVVLRPGQVVSCGQLLTAEASL